MRKLNILIYSKSSISYLMQLCINTQQLSGRIFYYKTTIMLLLKLHFNFDIKVELTYSRIGSLTN